MLKSILLNSAIAVLAFGSFAQAQTIKVDVPFDFSVGSMAKLPAGEYIVDTHSTTGIISLRSAEGKGGTHILSTAVSAKKATEGARLVFNKYGADRYFLAQVWEPGSSTGREIQKSRRELETAKAEPSPVEERILFAKSK